MKLPRMTTRRLMVAVVVLGTCLGLDGLRRRRAEYASRAAYHASQYRERQGRLTAWLFGMHQGRLAEFPGPIDASLIRHHSEMAAKYDRAARRPWLLVSPDPPEPKCSPMLAPGDGIGRRRVARFPRRNLADPSSSSTERLHPRRARGSLILVNRP